MKRSQRHTIRGLMLGCLAIGFPAHAQELAANIHAAPWMEEESLSTVKSAPAHDGAVSDEAFDSIEPRPLTVRDIEKLMPASGGGAGAAPAHNIGTTAVEAMYGARTNEDLTLFGYDLFDGKEAPSLRMPSGIVRDSYVLGQGDALEITVRGQENTRKTYEINAQGVLPTDTFKPVSAAGKTIGEVRAALEREAASLHNVALDIALTRARQMDVRVIGEVQDPGRKTLTPFHSVLDALQAAGGVKKTGSLRRIKLVRGGKSEFIDLYAVMMQSGSNADQSLRDGDRIIVPPIGPTVAVAGAVKRPAIYEIRKGEHLSALELLGLAGGVIAPGSNRFLRLAVDNDGRENVEEIHEPGKRVFGDGGVLNVAQAKQKRSRNVTLSGHTRDPGDHDLNRAKTLGELIKSDRVFGDALYPLIGVIERRDPKTLTTTLIEFSPSQVLQKNSDITLSEGDDVHLFSLPQIRKLGQNVAKEPLLKRASYNPAAEKDTIEDGAIASFLEERAAFVRGAVRQPGAYPVAAGTALPALIAVAGGATVEANADNIELTSRMIPVDEDADALGANRKSVSLNDLSSAKIIIAPGDTIRVNQKFNRVEDQSVQLLGEVKNPGRYDLLPGDTLLTLIERAGGISDIAYPDGAIFSRASERRQEESRYRAQARDLEMKIAQSLRSEDKDDKLNDAQVSAAQGIIAQLKDAKAVGRITVEADPGMLRSDPEQNILLEGGDKIYIPRRPLTVRVGGEVLSPAALQFRKGKNADTYIEEAGGTTYFADADRAFVVYPDGSAKPLSVSAWKQGITMVPPGSTIIVPRDPKPFNFLESAESITTILANIALTGFYLDDLGDDD